MIVFIHMRLTFNIEEPIARKFLSSVPDRMRSKVVTKLLSRALGERKKAIIRACLKANKDKDLNKVLDEWQSFDTPTDGEWS